MIILMIFTGSLSARPIWIASLESDGGIYIGGEYNSVAIKLSIFPTIFTVGYNKFDNSLIMSLSNSVQVMSSISKTFDFKEFKTGIDWRFRYTDLDYENDDGTKTSGDEFSNAFGYYISKQFNKIELHFGSYLFADYIHDYYDEYIVEDTRYTVNKNELTLSPKLLFGMTLRL